MSDEFKEEINEDDTANTPKDSEELVPLEVIIKEKPKEEEPDPDYYEEGITTEEIEEFENDSNSK